MGSILVNKCCSTGEKASVEIDRTRKTHEPWQWWQSSCAEQVKVEQDPGLSCEQTGDDLQTRAGGWTESSPGTAGGGFRAFPAAQGNVQTLGV